MNLRSKVRRRIRYSSLEKSLRTNFQKAAPVKKASVMGDGLISIDGRMYPSVVDSSVPAGTPVEVYNMGRPAAALYAPRVGGGSAIIGSGGSTSVVVGGGGGGDGMEVHALDGIWHSGTLAWASVGKTGSDIADVEARAHGSLQSIGVADHHALVTAAAGSGIDISAYPGQALTIDVTDFFGAGLAELVPNKLNVDLTNNWAWTGTHTFAAKTTYNFLAEFNAVAQFDAMIDANSTMDIEGQVNMAGDLVFDGTTPLITTTSNYDLTLSASGTGRILVEDTTTVRSIDYENKIPYIEGWSIWPVNAVQSQLTISKLYLDELYTRVFVADEVRVDRGEEFWGKSLGITSEEQTGPSAVGGSVTVWFEDSPALNGAIFSDGDWLMNRVFDDSAGLSITTNWYQCYSYHDGTAGEGREGEQSWSLTLRYGTTSLLHRKGQLFVDFGEENQGLIHLSTLLNADGPWINMFTWAGNPYVESNRTAQTVIGKLDGFTDEDMSLTGWGIYSQNAFLRGELRTGDTVINDRGFSTLMASASGFSLLDSLSFKRDTTEAVVGRISSRWYDVSDPYETEALEITMPHSQAKKFLNIYLYQTSTEYGRIQIRAEDVGSGTISNFNMWSHGLVELYAEDHFEITADVQIWGDIRPELDVTYNLGTPSFRFGTIYASNIVADSVSAELSITEAIGGQTWLYDSTNAMYISSDWAGQAYLFVTNTDASNTMHLYVDGNILVDGTVDGVDIAAFKSAYDAYVASIAYHVRAHDLDSTSDHSGTLSWSKVSKTGSSLGDLATKNYSQLDSRAHVLATNVGLGPDHTMTGASDGWVLRANSGTGAAWAQLDYSDLSGAPEGTGPHVLATTSALGTYHTVSGLTSGFVLRATGATTASFGVLLHSQLGTVSANQHHNEAHALSNSSVHTGLLPWSMIDPTGATIADLGGVSHDDLTGVTPSQHHDPVTAGNGIALSSQQVSVSLAATPGLEFSGGGLRIVNTLAGGGLTYSAGVLTVGAGDGISVAADSVAVNTSAIVGAGMTTSSNNILIDYTYDHVWTGSHAFRNSMSTYDLYPATTDTYDIGSSLLWYSSQYVSTINATVFAENTISVIGGWFYVAKYQGTFEESVAYNDPAINFGVDNSILAAGDFIIVKAHKGSSGDLATEYMTLVSYAAPYWTVTRDTAAAHGTDPDWSKGTPWVLLGNVGDGRIELNAYDGSNSRPRISMVEQGATYNAQTERLRIGNLYGTGVIGAAETYGMIVGNDVSLTAAGGFSGLLVTTDGLQLFSTDVDAYDGALHTLHIDSALGHIHMGSSSTSSNGVSFWEDTIDLIGGTKTAEYLAYGSSAAHYSVAQIKVWHPTGSALGSTDFSVYCFSPSGTSNAALQVRYDGVNSIERFQLGVYGESATVMIRNNQATHATWEGTLIGGHLDPSYLAPGVGIGMLSGSVTIPALAFSESVSAVNFLYQVTNSIYFNDTYDAAPTTPALSLAMATSCAGIGTTPTSSRLTVYEGPVVALGDVTQAVHSWPILTQTTYGANYYAGLVAAYTTDNYPTKPKAGIFMRETGSGTYLHLGVSADYSTGLTAYLIIQPDASISTADADTTHELGRASIGYSGLSDFAAFAHRDIMSATGYALLQASGGTTYLNAASGQTLNFRINNSNVAAMSATYTQFTNTLGEAWTGLSFGTGWAHYASGYVFGQYKKVGDLVFVRGLVKRTTTSSGDTVIATLPEGYIPAQQHIFGTNAAWTGYTGECRVDVYATGVIGLIHSVNVAVGWVTLNLCFSIA